MNAKELMRSRYDAFVREDWEYLADTSLHQSVEELQTSPPMEWLKLDILNVTKETVEFKAYYRESDGIKVLHEKSSFVEVDGDWKYNDGILYNSQVQRNESCPCGSGKKFKRCCQKR